MKINWKQKLTSRKFMMAVIGFITSMLAFFALSEEVMAQIVALVTATLNMVAYILGEGMVDAARVEGTVIVQQVDEPPEQE